ncbi:hypothetical protein Hanom_Chr04g00326451 [Helianthus anomalus]
MNANTGRVRSFVFMNVRCRVLLCSLVFDSSLGFLIFIFKYLRIPNNKIFNKYWCIAYYIPSNICSFLLINVCFCSFVFMNIGLCS